MFVCIIYIMFLISLQKKTDFINTILFSVVVFEGVSFVYLTRLVCLIWKDEVKHCLEWNTCHLWWDEPVEEAFRTICSHQTAVPLPPIHSFMDTTMLSIYTEYIYEFFPFSGLHTCSNLFYSLV